MAWTFTKTDSIADFVAVIYGKEKIPPQTLSLLFTV